MLRFYPSVEAADKGAVEYRVISYLAAAGYPVPRPHLFEPGGAAIGAPFLVMDRLSGGPLFAIRSFPQAFRTFSMGFWGFVRAQARLHRMALAPSALAALRRPAAIADQPKVGRPSLRGGKENADQERVHRHNAEIIGPSPPAPNGLASSGSDEFPSRHQGKYAAKRDQPDILPI